MIQDIAPHKYHNIYKNVSARDEDLIIICRGAKLLCRIDETAAFPTVAEAEKIWNIDRNALQFLTSVDEINFFMADPSLDASEAYEWHNNLDIRGVEPLEVTFAALVATHLARWYTANRFCGKCGHPTKQKADQRALVCTECGNMIFPRINPITITAVVDGDKMLVAKYNRAHYNNRNNNYVLLAGYVEIGESYEDTVRREVKEETGLDVKKLRYVGSQPWPFSDTAIAGFYAEADSTLPLKRQEEELSELLWVKREDLPPRKNRTSITDNLIEWFRHNMSLEEIQAERDQLD